MPPPMKKGGGGLGIMLEMGDEDESASDPMADKMSAARDMMSAMKDGDAEGVAHAFQAMYDACAAQGDGEEGYEDDELELEE